MESAGEGFTEEVTFDLGLGEGTGKNYNGGGGGGGSAHPPQGKRGSWGFFVSPVTDGHMPSCPPSLPVPGSLGGITVVVLLGSEGGRARHWVPMTPAGSPWRGRKHTSKPGAYQRRTAAHPLGVWHKSEPGFWLRRKKLACFGETVFVCLFPK